MHTSKNAFTLVELIVVITILAILGTIAFISLIWFTREARNVARSTDLNLISKQISLEITKWWNILDFINFNSWSTLEGTSISISWYSSYDKISDNYKAWYVNLSALRWLSPESIYDEDFEDYYKIWGTNIGGFLQYELAATIETESGLDTLVVWTWSPRQSDDTRGARESISWNIFYLSGATYTDLGYRIGDLVGISSGTGVIIDLKKWNEIHLDKEIIITGGIIFLEDNETRHLIQKFSSWDTPIDIGRWESFVPYK